jgi:hypothetical protein
MENTKPPTYQLFRVGEIGVKFTVLQVRAVNGGKALNALDLTAYVVLRPVETPWRKVTIGKGSRMLLADDAAAHLLSEAMIEPILSETLVPWRPAYEAAQSAKYESRRKDRHGKNGS